MIRWRDLECVAPTIASIGKSLLFKAGQGEVGILATVNRKARPRVAPVCPIFTAEGIYVSVTNPSPKLADLRASSLYALHAQIGADDLEFQITGQAREVTNDEEIAIVHAAIQLSDYDPAHPVFELLIAKALTIEWPAQSSREKTVWSA